MHYIIEEHKLNKFDRSIDSLYCYDQWILIGAVRWQEIELAIVKIKFNYMIPMMYIAKNRHSQPRRRARKSQTNHPFPDRISHLHKRALRRQHQIRPPVKMQGHRRRTDVSGSVAQSVLVSRVRHTPITTRDRAHQLGHQSVVKRILELRLRPTQVHDHIPVSPQFPGIVFQPLIPDANPGQRDVIAPLIGISFL